MRHEVIICTKDRPDELRRCLAALSLQDESPARVVVVDSSASFEPLAGTEVPFEIVHLPASPGLTHQRNVGLGMLLDDTEVVHFLDDDAVPETAYLREVCATFSRNPLAAGVGATVANLPLHKPWRSERFFNLNSRRQGSLLRSGVNILSFVSATDAEVDWLSGCCMSYRLERIRGLEFDERRLGNGLGEDVDFSARARVRGPLVWSQRARTQHLQSSVNRDDGSWVVRRGVLHRWQLALDGVGDVRRTAVVYSTAGFVLIQLGRAVRGRTLQPLPSARAAALGLADVALRRRP